MINEIKSWWPLILFASVTIAAAAEVKTTQQNIIKTDQQQWKAVEELRQMGQKQEKLNGSIEANLSVLIEQNRLIQERLWELGKKK